jgi:hypothetical protein
MCSLSWLPRYAELTIDPEVNPMARELNEYEQKLEALVRPLGAAKWQSDYHWNRLEHAIVELGDDHGGLELIPDFQRGHIWSPKQQSHFVENCLRRIVPSSGYLIQFNCPHWGDHRGETDLPAGLQCVDGLQRYTAITSFVRGEVKAFGLSVADFAGTQFDPKRFRMTIAVHDFTSRAELLAFYLALNSGGSQHSEEEIERVRGLLDTAKAGAI